MVCSKPAMALVFYVNGNRISEASFRADDSLASYLRERLRLTGCKIGCGVGMCGACTVLVSHARRQRSAADGAETVHEAVNACLMPLAACHHKAITTVECLGSVRSRLQPIQRALAEGHGVQCGFCSPGFVMSVYALMRTRGGAVSPAEVEQAVRGNLCRCTGYRPILESMRGVCCGGGCQRQDAAAAAAELGPEVGVDVDPSQELIFPPALMTPDTADVHLRGDGVEWYVPSTWRGIEEVLQRCPDAVVVGGNSMHTVRGLRHGEAAVVLQLSALDALHVDDASQTVILEAGLTLAGLERKLEDLQSSRHSSAHNQTDSAHATAFDQLCTALLHILRSHSTPQVKNVATVGATLASCRTYPYVATLLSALETEATVFDRHSQSTDTVPLTDLTVDGAIGRFVIKHVTVSLRSVDTLRFFKLHDQPLKYCMCIVTGSAELISVSAAHSRASDGKYRVSVMRGSSAECQVTACVSRWLDEKESELVSDDSTGQYCVSLLREWVHECFSDSRVQPRPTPVFPNGHGAQSFDTNLTSDSAIGKPTMSSFALAATAGEAEYVDDVPLMQDELHMALVTSSHAHAKILSIDASAALKVDGVVDFVSAKDVPCNDVCTVVPPADEEVFASSEVKLMGQAVGAIVAVSRSIALKAASLVRIEYEALPTVLTIEEAVENGQYHKSLFCPSYEAVMEKGDVDNVLKSDDLSIYKGSVMIEGQEHFYLEPIGSIVYPSKENNYIIYSATHNPDGTQRAVSSALQIPMHNIEVRILHLGGSYGGKNTKDILTCLPAAVAAAKHRQPMRLVLTRNLDIRLTGGRHPMLGHYEIGVDKFHRIRGIKMDAFIDGGFSNDVSTSVRDNVVIRGLTSYFIPAYQSTCRACKTNRSSNTAFRGYGGPQGMMATEIAIEHAAEIMNVCPDLFREKNLLDIGDKDPYGNIIEDNSLRCCWFTCKDKSDYKKRKSGIDAFNKSYTKTKRGIAIIPTMYGIGFNLPFLNQASALLHVYAGDGTVLLAHGGIDMGQGLDIKMRQVAAHTLHLPLEMIRLHFFSTNLIANSVPTSASVTCDLAGPAVIDACKTLKARLKWEPIDNESTEDRIKRWKEVVSAAYFSKVDLTAHGFFGHPSPGVTPSDGGHFLYHTCGAACSEVELNCATGEYRVMRTDIVMDVGKSLNPAIDVGQVEGGFMQGYGLFCKERLDFSKGSDGLPRRIVYDYPLPRARDIPAVFNVHLLTNSENTKEHAVYSSKGIGEPPLFLGSSVYFAMRRAVKAVDQRTAECKQFVRIDCPATSDRVKNAIEEIVTRNVLMNGKINSFIPAKA